jgi:hypothetical protein
VWGVDMLSGPDSKHTCSGLCAGRVKRGVYLHRVLGSLPLLKCNYISGVCAAQHCQCVDNHAWCSCLCIM